jgi:hypothetical protein
MRITRATPEDLDTLVAFRDQAAAWLASRGIDQWQEPWPTEDLMVEGMLSNIEAGETFIVWDDDDTPAATITINRYAKPELWTEEERARAGAVRPQGHRRSHPWRPGPRRRAAGLGRHARRRRGRPLAARGRADHQRAASALLPEAGLHLRRTVVPPHNPSGALFQRPAKRVPTPRLQDVESLTG